MEVKNEENKKNKAKNKKKLHVKQKINLRLMKQILFLVTMQLKKL